MGREILNKAKGIFAVNDFWKELSPLNRIIKKTSKEDWLKKRIVITEPEIVDGLISWLRRNRISAFFNPVDEVIRKEMGSSNACFFLLTTDEYMKRQETPDFQRIVNKMPEPLDLSMVGQDLQLNQEEVMSAFAEVDELPSCVRRLIEMRKPTLVNLVISLILFSNYMEFCSEMTCCTEEKNKKCKFCFSKISLIMKEEFFDLIRLSGIYYPISLYTKHQFPENNNCVDMNSYAKEFDNPLELAIHLHDAYRMGTVICPGFGIDSEIENKPDAFLLDYVYPLQKSIPFGRVSSLIFSNALKKRGHHIEDFSENIRHKIGKLPLGGDVVEHLSRSTALMNQCCSFWPFNKEDAALLYAIWKLKRMMDSSYQRTKMGLSKLNSFKVKALNDSINALLYNYKDFLEYDLALELGINANLAKEFFKNMNTISETQKEVNFFENLLLAYHDRIREKLKTSTITYATKKIAASQIWDGILAILPQIESLNSDEILDFLPFVIALFDYPIFGIADKVAFLQILTSKQSDQSGEVIDFIWKAVMDEIVLGPPISIEIDKLVNQWKTGNPLNFLRRKVEEEIRNDEFDPGLFRETFEAFMTINVLKLFRRQPSRFFVYQHALDRYIGLGMSKNGKQYFDCFKPITSIYDTIRELHRENKKVILLIFDGLGFVHSYFACLEISHRESDQFAAFSDHILQLFRKGKGEVLSSVVPTTTGVNHIALLFGERLLCEDSFLIRQNNDSFISSKSDEKASTFSILGLRDEDRKSASYRSRLEESNLQRPTRLWDVLCGQAQSKGLLISANSEKSFLSYLFRGDAAFKQVDSYTNAIEEALADKSHDLVVSQVNLMDAFLQSINVRPPAMIDDIVAGYWEAYLDLWRNVVSRISKGFRGLEKDTVLIITADHGMAWGETGEFTEPSHILGSMKGIRYVPKYNVGELVDSKGGLIGVCIPGHRSMKFMSIFLLKNGLDEKIKIRETLESARQEGKIFFDEVVIEDSKRNLTLKPDFLIFPIIGMFSRPDKRKYYGGIHGGISMCELFIPFVQLENR